MQLTMRPKAYAPRKLLVAAVGVATISYVAAACGELDGGPPTSGNLMAPTEDRYVPPTSGNLPAPPPVDASADADASDADADAGDADAEDADAGDAG